MNKELQSFQLKNLDYVGPFRSPVRNSHRKESYRYHETNGRKSERIVKYLPIHSVRSEVAGSTIFQVLGLKAPQTVPGVDGKQPVVVMEDLSQEYVADLTYGDGGVMADKELRGHFQESLIAAILIGDYDRVTWNTMIRRDYKALGFVDFGACLGSRAQGGYSGFSEHIDQAEILHCISNPLQGENPINPAFAELIDFEDGKMVVKNPAKVAELTRMLKVLDDDIIDRIVNLAGWPKNTILTKRKNRAYANSIVSGLEEKRQKYPEGNEEHQKLQRAIDTYQKIRDEYKGDFDMYFSSALKSRRDDLLKMFGRGEME